MIIHLVVGLKKIMLFKMTYFSELVHSKIDIKLKLDLFNYATESDLKRATGVDRSKISNKADLPSL